MVEYTQSFKVQTGLPSDQVEREVLGTCDWRKAAKKYSQTSSEVKELKLIRPA